MFLKILILSIAFSNLKTCVENKIIKLQLVMVDSCLEFSLESTAQVQIHSVWDCQQEAAWPPHG